MSFDLGKIYFDTHFFFRQIHIKIFFTPLIFRYYSISSSLKEHPGRVHVTSVVVEFETTAKRQHKGVCSNWLAAQVPRGGKKITHYFKSLIL